MVINASSGTIHRTLSGDPAMFAVQVQMGESLFALTEDDGAFIDDANILLSETGDWEVREGAPETVTVPGASLELIAT